MRKKMASLVVICHYSTYLGLPASKIFSIPDWREHEMYSAVEFRSADNTIAAYGSCQ